jgi:tetratricopeptide (TPR) repeat protein
MRAVQEPGRRLGQALIDEGVLRPDQLAAAVTGQVERIVFSVFRWTRGIARREPLEQPIPADLALDLNTRRILLQGVRAYPDAGRLAAALGAEGRRLRRTAPAFEYDRLPVSAVERAVLAVCMREATLGDVLRLPYPRPFLTRAAYALLVGGVIEDVSPARPRPAATAAPPPPRPATPAPAEAVAPPAPRAPTPTPAPASPDDAMRAAQHHLEKGLRERAIEILREAVGRWPDARACRRLLAMTLAYDPGFSPEVEQLFLRALESDSHDVELRYRLASYYRRSGHVTRALLQLRQVLAADPSHAAAWRDLGELEAGEGRRR